MDARARCNLVSYDQMLARMAYSDAAITQLEGDGVLAILAKRALCNDSLRRCDVVRRGRVLYRDSLHLNRWGSEEVIRNFQSQLLEVLSAAPTR